MLKKFNIVKHKDFQTLTYTDVHIGMDTDKYKNSMYPVEWNRESIISQLKIWLKKSYLPINVLTY